MHSFDNALYSLVQIFIGFCSRSFEASDAFLIVFLTISLVVLNKRDCFYLSCSVCKSNVFFRILQAPFVKRNSAVVYILHRFFPQALDFQFTGSCYLVNTANPLSYSMLLIFLQVLVVE